ncbi:TIGR02302 family protein [Neoroseomonas oryzicola]|uniref:TIGR02302 family protein n=1 Tax=Neoroseomonas oryzicola TaxID=535904 RepID=A0A9X9WDP6_9PROT|nr:TIGR02302 family protein [Neoroseomonas oryzicola]MBR0658456.1 TIGR02302 family protein [Neoroseomonas oryzicola]NKE17645.1 TIGR02302 family protein [Neoroseomonas oryzicola]
MTPQAPDRLSTRLARRTRLARLALWWEAAWVALWPPLGVIGLFGVVALSGLPLVLPWPLHLLLLAAFAAALGWTAWRAAQHLALPGTDAAERRLERDSGLAHRPIATLADRPSGNDPVALALWEAHRRRAAERLARLRVAAPHPGLARRDRLALRGGLSVALVAALVVAGPEAPERLRRALTPHIGGTALPSAPSVRLEAWITPPAYTGAAPLFLDPAGGAVTAPAGSRLQVALSGGSGGTPDLLLDGTATPFRGLDRGSFAIEVPIEQGGRLTVRRDGTEVAAWTLAVRADAPPTAAWDQPPARATRGLAIRLPWRAEDDWGLAGLRVELRLKPRPEAEPVVLDLPIPSGNPRSARGAAQPDLSAHPWAGLEVEARLVARDHAGQEGRSEGAFLELPERSFTHPVSQQLIALRKALSVDPTGREPARRELDRIAASPEAFEHDTGTYLALRSARHRLQRDRRPAAIAEVQEILWTIALALEEGRTDRTARALAEARQALRDALEEARRDPQNRSEEQRAELQRRIEELREAIRRHLEALAERLQRENAEALPYDPQQRLMDQRELDRRTRRMEQAAREGRPEDAERELAELEEMLRGLEEGRNMRAEDRQRQQQRQRGNQQMGAVQDMVRRQAEMLDRAHQRGTEAERERAQQPRQSFRPFQQPPQQQPQADSRAQDQRNQQSQQDARVQRAMRRALGELMQQFGDLTGDVPPQLGEADRAMRDSAEALREGRDSRDAQQRAIRALTEGGRQMAQQMQRQFGQGQAGEGEEEDGEGEGMAGGQQGGEGQDQAQEQGQGRDPLGRRTREAPGGQDNASDTRVPDEAEMLKTRRIQEELRRRGADRERPPAELDYIDRLLRQF